MGADKNSSLWLNSTYTPIATPRTYTHKQDPKQGPNNLKGTTKKPRDKKRKLTNKKRSTSSELQKPVRTVRVGPADRPRRGRGPSGHHTRTVRKSSLNQQSSTPNNGPSAGSTRTVRQAPADCPPGTHGPSETSPNQNSKSQRIENEDEQEYEKHTMNTVPADRPPGPRGPSARHGQNQKLLDPESQHLQSITGSPKR
jgi:hypothetical protein